MALEESRCGFGQTPQMDSFRKCKSTLGNKMAAKEKRVSGYRVVHDLTRVLVGKNYHIFCDNFFTSVKLAEDLLRDKIYLCGMTRANQKEFPCELKPQNRAVKDLRRGQSLFRQKGNLVAAIWKNKKPVCFLSTQCEVRGGEVVQRKQKDGTIIDVPSLPVVSLYNQNMGGVDLADQMRQFYAVGRRSEKWWKYLLWFVLDDCVVNAHILMKIAENHPSLDQLGFRLELVKKLIGGFTSRRHNPVEVRSHGQHWTTKMTKGRCNRCLKRGKTTFCRMGCELCGKRICLDCFKNPSADDL